MTRKKTSHLPPLSPAQRAQRQQSRRRFMAGAGAAGGVSVLEWLGFFREHGVPGTAKDWGIAQARAQEDMQPGGADEKKYLIYWFLEGGWMSYSMFSPVNTPNHAAVDIPAGTLNPSPPWSDQRYRVTGYEDNNDFTRTTHGIQHGYLADDGTDLFADMCVLSSHVGNTFHSGSRWNYHYGSYGRGLSALRGEDERSVLQAFCEEKGAGYLLPHISWHRWLSDGELDPAQYPEGTGYYERLGPVHAHTIYGRTPNDLKSRLAALGDVAANQRRRLLRDYTDNLHQNFINGRDGRTIQAFNSALTIHRTLSEGEINIDLGTLFADPALREEFNIAPGDENPTFTPINGNPARSKDSPHLRVQTMMAYELMRADLSCGLWLESRAVRGFDTHRSRNSVMNANTQPDQKQRMKDDLWDPLRIFVNRLKTTEAPGLPGVSLYDQTTLVITSEMGRTISGDVGEILNGDGTTNEKYAAILDQDICQHWDVNACVFMGGSVKPNTQFGRVGTATLDPIPVMPDGSLDPAYDATTGLLLAGQERTGMLPNAGHIYSTALELAGVNPDGKGRNESPPLGFIKRDS